MFPSFMDYRNADEIDDIKDIVHTLQKDVARMTGAIAMLGSTEKEEVQKRDELPEHVKTASRMRAATSNIAGLSAQAQIQEQRIDLLFEKLTRIEQLYGTLLGKMEQFEKQYVRSLQTMVGGGPTVRS